MTHISCVCVGLNSEIIIADSRVQIFSADGIPQKEITVESTYSYITFSAVLSLVLGGLVLFKGQFLSFEAIVAEYYILYHY
jgi:hypothetical protein